MTPSDKVFNPGPRHVFVFGSNRAGIHGAGAAHTALEYGAEYGKGEGLYGNTYAIPTKNEHLETLSLEDIQEHVDRFLDLAWERSDLLFFVTRIGCGLAGYTDNQIAPMFREAPLNCELPENWRL